jgi:hypothetical protein
MTAVNAASYETLSYGSADGCRVVGSATDKLSFWGGTPAVKPAALTAQLTTVTIADAAGSPDYALQAVINTNAYGFASAAEAITFLYVVKNLQTRVAELEARLVAVGALASA